MKLLALAAIFALAAADAPTATTTDKYLPTTKCMPADLTNKFDSWGVKSTWQVFIQDLPVIPSADGEKLVPDADVWEIDLFQANRSGTIVESLHELNKTVICYFNFGAIQPEDSDFRDWLVPVGDKQLAWGGVWYNCSSEEAGSEYCEKHQDVTTDKSIGLLKSRLDMAVHTGCDGVDPDNIDVYQVDDLNLKESDVVELLRGMADYAHKKTTTRKNSLMFGQKNAPNISDSLVDCMDFAVLERCREDKGGKVPFCNKFANYLSPNHHKPVLAIEYPLFLRNETDSKNYCNMTSIPNSAGQEVCKSNGVPEGMSTILKIDSDKGGLNGCTQYCGPNEKVILTPGENLPGSQFPLGNCTKELSDNKCCMPQAIDHPVSQCGIHDTLIPNPKPETSESENILFYSWNYEDHML